MKVLQVSTPFLPVTPDLEYGGSERIVYLLDKELHSRGLSAGVVAPVGSKPESRLYSTILSSIGVDDILDKASNSFEGFALRAEHIAQSIKYSNNLDVDVIHLHDDNILIFDFLLNKPSLITLHSDLDCFWDLSKNPSFKDRKSKFVSISESHKRICESRGHKIDYVVYNGVDEDKFGLSNLTYPYLLSVGSIRSVKGQDNAIEVAKRTGLDLIIAGNVSGVDFYEEKIKPHITHYLEKEEDKLNSYLSLGNSFGGRVIYVGAVNDEQKAPLYSHATAFLMPIEWEEPFGLVMVESMMSGTPVVGFNKGSVPEVVEEDAGIVVNNLEEMVESVRNLGDYDRRKVRDVAVRKFGKTQMIESYIKVYEDLIR